MRHLVVWVLALVIAIGFSTPSAWCEDSKTMKSKVSPLSVKLDILSEQYCRSGTDYFRVKCRIQFTNIGKERLILDKRIGTVYSLRVAQTRKDLESKRLMVIEDFEIEHAGEGGKIRNLQIPSPDEFVILKKGESFKKETSFDLSGQRGDIQFNPTFPPGEYLVKIAVETWVDSPDLGPILQDRWKKWGRLWHSYAVNAEPLRVTIAEDPKIEDCTQKD